MPPESSRGYADSNPSRPMRSMAASERRRISSLRQALRFESERDVLEHREPGKDREALEHHGDARAPDRRPAGRDRCSLPPLGLDRPAISRSSVDLPDPERPRSPTISPSLTRRFTPSSTSSSPPSAFGKVLRTSRTSSNGAVFMSRSLSRAETCVRRSSTAAARRSD